MLEKYFDVENFDVFIWLGRRVATWILPSADQPRAHLADNTAAEPNGNLQEDLKEKKTFENIHLLSAEGREISQRSK